MKSTMNNLNIAEIHSPKDISINRVLKTIATSSETNILREVITCISPLYEDFLINGYSRVNVQSYKDKIKSIEDAANNIGLNMDLINQFTIIESDNQHSTPITIQMKPNQYLKEISIVLLKHQIEVEASNFVDQYHLRSTFNAQKKYEEIKDSLQACKDKDFVKAQLEPFAKKFLSEKNKVKDAWKIYDSKNTIRQEELEKFINSTPTSTSNKKIKP